MDDVREENGNFTLNEDINGPVLSAFFSLVMAAALITNLFVIIVTFCNSKSLKQPSTIFLTSLLLADLVVVIFVMPFSVISTASGGWIFGETIDEKHGVCQFAGYMFWYSVLLVTVTLAILSFDRFLSIVKPFVHKRYMKPHVAVIIIIIAWIICALLNTTPLYGFGIFLFASSHGTCIPSWAGEVPYLSFFLVIFLTLIGTIVVTSIWTCCFTRKFIQRHQTDDNIYVNKNRKVIGIFGSLLLVCALCFGPGILTAVATLFIYVPYGYAISVFCFYFLTLANPLVQSCFRPDIKGIFRYLTVKCVPRALRYNVDNQQATMTSSTTAL